MNIVEESSELLNEAKCRERKRKSEWEKVIKKDSHMIVMMMWYQVHRRETNRWGGKRKWGGRKGWQGFRLNKNNGRIC